MSMKKRMATETQGFHGNGQNFTFGEMKLGFGS